MSTLIERTIKLLEQFAEPGRYDLDEPMLKEEHDEVVALLDQFKRLRPWPSKEHLLRAMVGAPAEELGIEPNEFAKECDLLVGKTYDFLKDYTGGFR